MPKRQTLTSLAAVTLLIISALPASAQIIIVNPLPDDPEPVRRIRPIRPAPLWRNTALQVKKLAVEIEIEDGVARTSIDQLFSNPFGRTVEGTFMFPLGDNVGLSEFSMFVGGKEIEGKLLDVGEARRVYESIVARRRDPALLEYVGSKLFRARIFPIAPHGEVRVKLSYTQTLKAEDGLVRYRYPLKADKHLPTAIDLVSVVARIKSTTPIKSVFSPTHKVAVHQASEKEASASFEQKNIHPDRDFDLYYSLGNKEFGLTLMTYSKSGEDGYFLARIAPPPVPKAKDVLPKDIAFVIDTSGSMAGEKMEQAKEALKFCLANLNPKDRFNLVPFSHEPITFRDSLVEASRDNIGDARKFADELRASGGTNINDALMTALSFAPEGDASRPYLIVFLTDGQPTIGVTNAQEILKNVSGKNTQRVRLFVFGVGHDVNTHLLDLLAEQNRGDRDYVEPGENLELKLSGFYRKVADPVLADLALSFGDLRTYDLYPPRLGDLFSGTELVVTGRYKGEGMVGIKLTGQRLGEEEDFVYEAGFAQEDGRHEYLPRLWATRKVGYLLDEMRLHGENKELKDTVVELAVKHGIITPYTSYLVLEPGVKVPGWMRSEEFNRSQGRLREIAAWEDMVLSGGARGGGGGRATARARSGGAAVRKSQGIAALRRSVTAPPAPMPAAASPRRPAELMVGRSAPGFDLTTIGGRSFSSTELAASKATVINFFAGNDPFSQKQLPRVEAVRRRWEGRGVRFVNVSQTMRNQRFSNAQLVEMMKRLGVEAELVADPNNQAGPAFEATSFPSLFVVGSNGVIESAIIGNAADLEQRLETELTIALDPAAVALRAAQRAASPLTVGTTRPARGPVQHVGARTFYQVGERWLDSAYKDEMTTKKVEAFSEDYFKLTRDHPELGPCFAIGQRVVVVFEGTAYEVVVPDGV